MNADGGEEEINGRWGKRLISRLAANTWGDRNRQEPITSIGSFPHDFFLFCPNARGRDRKVAYGKALPIPKFSRASIIGGNLKDEIMGGKWA